mgnify:CR=1 FL=1
MSHNRDLSAAAGQFGFHSSNIGIGSEAPRYALDVYNSNLLVSGPSAGNIILEDRGVGDSSRPFHVVSSDGGKFVINRSNRNASGTTTSSVNSLTLSSSGNLGLGVQTSPAANIHIGDISNGYELKITANALQFNRSSNSYIDQVHDTGSILFRMGSSHAEAMRITSDGNIGIDCTPNDHNSFTRALDVNGPSGAAVYMRTNDSTSNCFIVGNYGSDAYLNNRSNGNIRLYTSGTERLRLDNNGTLLVNSAIDNTSHHGRIVVHAPTSGTTIYKAIEIGNTSASGTARGATICGQPKSDSHLPYTLIGSWDHGDNTDVYYGGGWGGAMRPATRHRFYTNSSYPTSGGSGSERMILDGDGYLTLPYQPLFQATGQPSHRYMNSWHSVDLPDWNFVTQNGSNFNNSNGRFTAPVAGKYYFIFTAMYTNPSTNDVATYIIKNGTTEVLSNNHSGGGSSNGHQWNDITVHAIVNMAANDWVSSRMVGNSSSTCYFYGSSGSKYGSFCGFLIG